jgi:hypothetical protein
VAVSFSFGETGLSRVTETDVMGKLQGIDKRLIIINILNKQRYKMMDGQSSGWVD